MKRVIRASHNVMNNPFSELSLRERFITDFMDMNTLKDKVYDYLYGNGATNVSVKNKPSHMSVYVSAMLDGQHIKFSLNYVNDYGTIIVNNVYVDR